MPVRFARNLSATTEIGRHLEACSARFVPPLDTRVAIPTYAAKLADRAERFEAWDGSRLIGLVAVYCTVESREAFVSNVSVEPGFARQGIGRTLLRLAIDHARRHADSIVLEVDQEAAALALYVDLGFQVERQAGATLTLRLPSAT